MPKLKGPSSVSRKCSKTEHLTITTDPARRGLRIRGQRSNNTISFLDGTAGSHAQKTTDANGTATFKIQCNSALFPDRGNSSARRHLPQDRSTADMRLPGSSHPVAGR